MLLEQRVGQATTEAEAVRFALDLYGLDVSAKALPGEYDDNFHLTTIEKAASELRASESALRRTAAGRIDGPASPWPGGPGFVLKVMHPAREESLIDMQCRALQHLAQRAPQLNLPRVCLAKSGEAFTVITAAAGYSHLVWLHPHSAG